VTDPASVRPATEGDAVAVARVVDGALLSLPFERLRAAIDRGDALVAERDGRVVGAVVLDGDHVEAVAVARRRRRSGIGTALIEAAAERAGALTATCRGEVVGFYERLGFAAEPLAAVDDPPPAVRERDERGADGEARRWLVRFDPE